MTRLLELLYIAQPCHHSVADTNDCIPALLPWRRPHDLLSTYACTTTIDLDCRRVPESQDSLHAGSIGEAIYLNSKATGFDRHDT